MAWYVYSLKAPGLRFKITKLDTKTLVATLLGDTGVPFEKTLNQETLDKYGYELRNVKEEKVDG